MKKILVKDTEHTRSLGIACCDGYVEQEHEGGSVSVLIHDPFDRGLCGPFTVSSDEVEFVERASNGRQGR